MRRLTLSIALALPALPLVAQTSFEVAAIRPANPNARGPRIQFLPGGRVVAPNITLLALIEEAYQTLPIQISGGPGWAGSVRFAVEAKGPDQATTPELRKMLQAMLAERFQLEIRRETRELPLYALGVRDAAKASVKLKPAEPSGAQTGHSVSTSGRGATYNHIALRGQTMRALALELSRQLQRVVVDETGLTGAYDAEFDATREEGEPNPFVVPWAPAMSEIGLKLDSRRGPVEILTIDRAELPTEN